MIKELNDALLEEVIENEVKMEALGERNKRRTIILRFLREG